MPRIAMATSSVVETDEEASTTRVDDLIQRGRSQGHLSLAELRSAFAVGWSIELIKPALFDVTIDSNGAQAWWAEIRRDE